MAVTTSEFVTALAARVPETNAAVNEHLVDHEGELLLHLAMGDLRRLAIDWFGAKRTGALGRLLSVLEWALREGDEYVQNAVAVSFIEDLGWWEPDMRSFIESLPAGLTSEVERQRSHGQ